MGTLALPRGAPADSVAAMRHALSSHRVLLLFALAWSGGSVAYVPLLTLPLPERVSALAGSADVWWLAMIGVAGAVAASAGNLAFGWLSDRLGGRPWMAAGLAATLALLLPIAGARDPATLLLLGRSGGGRHRYPRPGRAPDPGATWRSFGEPGWRYRRRRWPCWPFCSTFCARCPVLP